MFFLNKIKKENFPLINKTFLFFNDTTVMIYRTVYTLMSYTLRADGFLSFTTAEFLCHGENNILELYLNFQDYSLTDLDHLKLKWRKR